MSSSGSLTSIPLSTIPLTLSKKPPIQEYIPLLKEPFRRIEDIKGTIPSERYGHSAVIDEGGGGVIIIFGGCDGKGNFCGDVRFYNIENRTWNTLDNSQNHGTAPDGRLFHTAVLYNGAMYVFGGNSNGYYNDLQRFHLETQRWSQIYQEGGDPPPSPRYGHSAVVFGDSMYIFGGYDKDGFACNDLHEYNFKTERWQRIKGKGIVPPDVYHHTAVIYQGSMYVFGGYRSTEKRLIEYRFGTGTWSYVNTSGNIPKPRWGHKSAVSAGVMYIFGGRDSTLNSNDLFELHFDSLAWRQSPSDGISARFFSPAVVHDEHMYIFGGRNIYNFNFNDIYECDLENKSSQCTLVEDMMNLLNEGVLSDVIFVFPKEGGKQIKAHKNIVSVRCSIFQAMFRSGMKECNEGLVVVDDIKHSTFLSLLEYLYSGLMSAPAEKVVDLMQAADKYGLEHLKYLCEKKISRYIDRENVLELFMVADRFKALHLKACCLRFIVKNYSRVSRNDRFGLLSPELLAEIQALRKDP